MHGRVMWRRKQGLAICGHLLECEQSHCLNCSNGGNGIRIASLFLSGQLDFNLIRRFDCSFSFDRVPPSRYRLALLLLLLCAWTKHCVVSSSSGRLLGDPCND